MASIENETLLPRSEANAASRPPRPRFGWLDGLAVLGLALALYVLLLAYFPFQGWGGDYAGYLMEARSIAEGRSLRESHYLYNPTMPGLAPPAYPPGWPLVLAPFYAKYGLEAIAVYINVTTVTCWLAGVALFFFLRRSFSTAAAFIASVLFIFNPYNYDGRITVLPDYLFCALTLGGLYWHCYRDPARWSNAAMTGLWVGAAWLMRANGSVLLLAIALDAGVRSLLQWRHNRQISREVVQTWRYLAIVGVTAVALLVLVQYVVWPLPQRGSYFDQLPKSGQWISTMRGMFDKNLEATLKFFQLEQEMTFYRVENKDIAARIGGAIALGFALFGLLLMPGDRAARFLRLFIALFVGVLLIFNGVYGTRYMLPVYALLVYFLLRALAYVDLRSRVRNTAKWLIIPVLLGGAYVHVDYEIAAKWRSIDGLGTPEHATNQEAFRYVRENVPADAVFAYHHPLIFGYYGDRKAMRWTRGAGPDQMLEEFRRFGVTHLMVQDWQLDNDPALKAFLKEKPTALDTVWTNERNVLYKFK